MIPVGPLRRLSWPVWLLLLVLGGRAAGAELPDPWASWQARHAIVCLAGLRAPLDAAPDDHHLLGLAIMAYVDLALGGEPDTCGMYGPWLGYARTLAQRRANLRQGQQAATLKEAEPELWVALLDGDAKGTLEAVKLWPQEQDTPAARLLRTLATRDWQILDQRPNLTPHEQYALMSADLACRHNSPAALQATKQETADPFVAAWVRWRLGGGGNPPELPRQVATDIAWMLCATDLDDATACRYLRELGEALGLTLAATATRADLVMKVQGATLNATPTNLKALAVLVRITDACCELAHGIMDANGKHRLVGLGDVALWNRDRLGQAMFFSYKIFRKKKGFAAVDSDFTEALRALAPESVAVARLGLGYVGTDPSEGDEKNIPDGNGDRFAAVIAKELARPRRISDAALMSQLGPLARLRHPAATRLFQEIMRHWRAAGDPAKPLRAGLNRFIETARDLGLEHELAPEIAATTARDPYDEILHRSAVRTAPDRQLLRLDGLTPTDTWIDAAVSFPQLPFPQFAVQEWFAIRWQGWLRITEPGTYRLAVESDDGSLLVVGTVVVDNDGTHGMEVRESSATLPVGWQPLRLEYFQGNGGAGCRLLWQPPGAMGMEMIPAANLAHGDDHSPGLAAELYVLGEPGLARARRPSADLCAWVEARPYYSKLLTEQCTALFEAQAYAEALALISCSREWQYDLETMRGSCLILKDPPDVPAARDCFHQLPPYMNFWWDIHRNVRRIRELGMQPDLLDDLQAWGRHDWLPMIYLRGILSFDLGDFQTAADCLPKVLAATPDVFAGEMETKHFIQLSLIPIQRLLARPESDFDVLGVEFVSDSALPVQGLALEYLSGVIDWATAQKRIAKTKEGERLYFFKALQELAEGDHDAARGHLKQTLETKAPGLEAFAAKSLLAWYARQTPETLQALHRAPPIQAKPKKREANDDF